MYTPDLAAVVAPLFAELTQGPPTPGGAFMLNSCDVGLLRSLDALPAADASRGVNNGAPVAAHAQHLRYGLSLMNRWATEGGNPFADATWDLAWTISTIDDAAWVEIRQGLRTEVERWQQCLKTPREARPIELQGMISSIAHLAYHLGAIRQIAAATRGPREGTHTWRC